MRERREGEVLSPGVVRCRRQVDGSCFIVTVSDIDSRTYTSLKVGDAA